VVVMPGGLPPEPPAPPLRPQSPFVTRLRSEVAHSRQPSPPRRANWELAPSIASWLTPRSRQRDEDAQREAPQPAPREGPPPRESRKCVSFVEASIPAGTAAATATAAEEAAPEEATDAAAAERPVSPAKLELRIKGTAAKPFTLEAVAASLTVAELKALCQGECGLPPEQQRMLYKGKLLQDASTLEELKLPAKATLFLVKGVAASAEGQEEVAREAERKKEQEHREEEARVIAQGNQGPPCIGCGVNAGRMQTNGLCSICWREQVVRENKDLKRRREEAKLKEIEMKREAEEQRKREEEAEKRRQQDPTRCYGCRKKIGLTGFQCQCGYFFCAKHRYAEEHECSFDHKNHGRELLAQQAGSPLP